VCARHTIQTTPASLACAAGTPATEINKASGGDICHSFHVALGLVVLIFAACFALPAAGSHISLAINSTRPPFRRFGGGSATRRVFPSPLSAAFFMVVPEHP
jgi:hypothetical protein